MIEQKDYILREIEKIGAMLKGMIGKMKKIEENELSEEPELTAIEKDFSKNTGFDLDNILMAPEDKLDKMLTKELGFDTENIELLGDLLVLMIPLNKYNTDEIKTCAIDLYELADRKSRTYSMERTEKIKRLKKDKAGIF